MQRIADVGQKRVLVAAVMVGLVAAACISGLPSASCYAVVETYQLEIQWLGQAFVYLVLAPVLALAVLGGSENLKRATAHCFLGTRAEIDAGAHDKISLIREFADFSR